MPFISVSLIFSTYNVSGIFSSLSQSGNTSEEKAVSLNTVQIDNSPFFSSFYILDFYFLFKPEESISSVIRKLLKRAKKAKEERSLFRLP